jgi:hypothetical protein
MLGERDCSLGEKRDQHGAVSGVADRGQGRCDGGFVSVNATCAKREKSTPHVGSDLPGGGAVAPGRITESVDGLFEAFVIAPQKRHRADRLAECIADRRTMFQLPGVVECSLCLPTCLVMKSEDR